MSCVMPTRNRAQYIPAAIRSYRAQTYLQRELLILDNGETSLRPLIPYHPTIRYERITGDHSTGDMRNLAVDRAKGEIICHWDDDDWSHPTRIADQLLRLSIGTITGYSQMFFYDERDQKCYHWYMNPLYALGTSFCYRKSWWSQGHHFKEIPVGEDALFFQEACREAPTPVQVIPGLGMMVARVHDQQTSKKLLHQPAYHPVPISKLPMGFPCNLMSLAT